MNFWIALLLALAAFAFMIASLTRRLPRLTLKGALSRWRTWRFAAPCYLVSSAAGADGVNSEQPCARTKAPTMSPTSISNLVRWTAVEARKPYFGNSSVPRCR
jgi:hypothetical protein